MIELGDEELQKWKDALAKDGIHYANDVEYREAISNLVGYFDTLIQIDMANRIKYQDKEQS